MDSKLYHILWTLPWTLNTPMDYKHYHGLLNTTTDTSVSPWTLPTTMNSSTLPRTFYTVRGTTDSSTQLWTCCTPPSTLTLSWTFYTLLWTLQFTAIRDLFRHTFNPMQLDQLLTTSAGIQSAWFVLLVVSTYLSLSRSLPLSLSLRARTSTCGNL